MDEKLIKIFINVNLLHISNPYDYKTMFCISYKKYLQEYFVFYTECISNNNLYFRLKYFEECFVFYTECISNNNLYFRLKYFEECFVFYTECISNNNSYFRLKYFEECFVFYTESSSQNVSFLHEIYFYHCRKWIFICNLDKNFLQLVMSCGASQRNFTSI